VEPAPRPLIGQGERFRGDVILSEAVRRTAADSEVEGSRIGPGARWRDPSTPPGPAVHRSRLRSEWHGNEGFSECV